MRKFWKIRLLAILLMLIFGFGSALMVFTFYSPSVVGVSKPVFVFGLATNIAFVIAAIGLLKIKPWGLWLTVGLCVVSILQLLWQLFTTLTPEAATKPAEIASYVVAGFYLGIAFFLTNESTRKCFKREEAPQLR